MAEAKGLVFQGQDNTGYATVLDQQPSPQAIMQPLLNRYVEREWDKIQKAEADKKLRDANLAKLQQIVPTWDKTKEVRSQQIEKLIGAGAAIASAGGDPQTMPEFLKMERDVNYAIEQDTMARDAFGKIIKEYQTGKYDEQVFQNFLDELEKTSPEEASKLVLNSNPLMPKVTPFEELDKFVPEAATNEQRQGGEYVTKTGVAEETLDAAAKQYGALYPKQLEHLIRTGQAKDATEAKDLIKEEIRRRSKSSTTLTPVPKGGGGLSFSVGGYQVPEKVSVAAKNTFSPDGSADEVSVKYNDKDIVPMEVVDRKGNLIYFKPAIFYNVYRDFPSGLKQGDWGVKGKVFRRSGEQIVDEAKAEEFFNLKRSQGAEVEMQNIGNGKVKITTFEPLADEVVSYSQNDIRFQTQLQGFDLFEYVE
jgi:hypothetical protein